MYAQKFSNDFCLFCILKMISCLDRISVHDVRFKDCKHSDRDQKLEVKDKLKKTEETHITFTSAVLEDKMAISKKLGERILEVFGNSRDKELKTHTV